MRACTLRRISTVVDRFALELGDRFMLEHC